MRHTVIVRMVSLSFLFIITLPVSSAQLSLQQEYKVTSSGTIIIQENPPSPNVTSSYFDTSSIIFEYGAESLTLPQAFPESYNLDLRISDGRLSIVNSPKISGNKVIQAYHPPPPKDYEHKYNTFGKAEEEIKVQEGYYSCKIVFSDLSLLSNPDWGPYLCDWQIWWGPETKPFAWWVGSRFSVTPTTKRLQVTLTSGRLPDGTWFNDEHIDVFGVNPRYEPDHMDWYSNELTTLYNLGAGNVVRLMGYWKIDGTDCYAKAWVNDELIMDLGPFKFDPREYPEWYSNSLDGTECVFQSGLGKPVPNVSFGPYQGELSFENKVWYDDIVIATEYIPMSYEVTDY